MERLDDAPPAGFRCGFVAILGKPNAGKSTLLNRLVGGKIAIVSPRPQTTRDRINGILTENNCQMIFVDMPGLVAPTDRLNEALVDSIHQGLDGVDVVIHLIDVEDKAPLVPPVGETLAGIRVPIIAVLNKTDRFRGNFNVRHYLDASPARIEPERYRRIVPVSALDGTGIEDLKACLAPLLPEGPPLHDPDDLTDRDMRWLAAEAVREQVFLQLGEELPYCVAAQTEEFKERPDGKWYIRAVIYIERESQKGIVIGAGGQRLKAIGQAARKEIEDLLDHPVFLELWVKVRKNWRKKDADLRMFGYLVSPKKHKRNPQSRRAGFASDPAPPHPDIPGGPGDD